MTITLVSLVFALCLLHVSYAHIQMEHFYSNYINFTSYCNAGCYTAVLDNNCMITCSLVITSEFNFILNLSSLKIGQNSAEGDGGLGCQSWLPTEF